MDFEGEDLQFLVAGESYFYLVVNIWNSRYFNMSRAIYCQKTSEFLWDVFEEEQFIIELQ